MGDTPTKNRFVLIYHPKCPACHELAPEFKKFAKKIADDKAELEIDVVNISKTDKKSMGAPHYPFMILIKKGEKRDKPDHGFNIYDSHNRNVEDFVQYLNTEGIK